MTNAPIFISRDIAADILSVSTVTIDRLVQAGKLRATRVGRRVLFTQRDLQQFADRQRRSTSCRQS